MTDSAYPGFLGLDIPPSSYEEARIHIIPVEMEKSVSYGGGAAAGPRAILEASLQLEAFDEGAVPGQAGIYTHAPLACRAAAVEEDLAEIAAAVEKTLRNNGLPVLLGGEHTITLGALRAIAARGDRFGVVQFDAHADLRDSYEGDRFSHACVMRRVHEMEIPFVQIGIRSLSEAEDVFRRQHAIHVWDAARLYQQGIPAEVLPRDFPEQIYITFDVDCFDASVMPATGTPEPGGLTWYQVLDLLHRVAAAIVELAPIPGLHACDFTAAKLVYKLMGLAVGEKNNGLRR